MSTYMEGHIPESEAELERMAKCISMLAKLHPNELMLVKSDYAPPSSPSSVSSSSSSQ